MLVTIDPRTSTRRRCTATKGPVNSLVQSMAPDLGRDGIRVNAIAPAFTATRLTQERLDNPAFWAALRDRIALDRAAEPADVAPDCS